jgi:hypothetical protein
MSISTNTRRFSLLGTLAASAIGIAALVAPLAPAKAQAYFGVGPFGVAIGAPSPVYTYPPSVYTYPPPAYPYYYAPAPAYYDNYPGYYYPRW